jgi:lipoprotein-anchoring transpeptidase ErfK/SrfK
MFLPLKYRHIQMLRQSFKLVIITFAFVLNSHPAIPLASELTVTSQTSSNNLVANDSNTLPLHLKISLSDRQVTLYRGKTQIKSYPIAVGRQGWETPIGNFHILNMLKNPTWINPFTEKAIPGGHAKNPLGNYWIGFWTDGKNWVGFHGTPNPDSIGKAVSHGCIRMYNQDIKELFHQVDLGTPVTVEP